jgi:hypothetical protein
MTGVMARVLLSVLLMAGCMQAFAQSSAEEERRMEAERRALDAERRALEAEKRAVEAERRASQGSSQPSGRQQACQAATATYQFNCSRPSTDPLWETTQCADARRLMLEKCG